jgi:hypothetical protein
LPTKKRYFVVSVIPLFLRAAQLRTSGRIGSKKFPQFADDTRRRLECTYLLKRKRGVSVRRQVRSHRDEDGRLRRERRGRDRSRRGPSSRTPRPQRPARGASGAAPGRVMSASPSSSRARAWPGPPCARDPPDLGLTVRRVANVRRRADPARRTPTQVRSRPESVCSAEHVFQGGQTWQRKRPFSSWDSTGSVD